MKNYLSLIVCLLTLTATAQDNRSALIPMPNNINEVKGKPFNIDAKKTTIYISHKELLFAATTLQQSLKERMQVNIPISELTPGGTSTIRLQMEPEMTGKEHYSIWVDGKGVTIRGANCAAIYYGVMTMDQLFLGDGCSTEQKKITPIAIDDTPRFAYRALMLDPARNFLSVEDIKFYIDQMAHYKYNVLQLHLTDDQGWRIEIKKHPKLTGKKFYTQQQLKELIGYAAERHVEIVPEIDIPGHTVAILAAYPELGCTHTDTIEMVVGKSVEFMLCANNKKVYSVLKDIIDEVALIFPSKYIHLGGDEAAVEKNWTKCSRCRALMAQMGYTKTSQLMIPFFAKMIDFVRKDNKQPILWCELDNIYPPANDYLFPYPKDVTLVSWRGGLTPTCLEITAQHGNNIIMAPGEYAYLDYPQLEGDLPEFNNWGMPVTTLEKCYQFDPAYSKAESEQTHIQGIMGTLWGEAIKDINRLMYMTYPRALALAEAGWTQMQNRNFESFKERLYPNLMNLIKQGVSVRVPFEIVNREK
ncbi:MAG: beta-N-acetylhexosaminidase [Mucinivorans sp.]